MTREQLLTFIKEEMGMCYTILDAKNKDYAVDEDAFLNFNNSITIGVTPQRAILVRLMDKMTRISNLLDKDESVQDEKINDTIRDAVNYLLILSAMLSKK
jgi:hypothetical protein